eukprot:4919107-Alexandrium_andersonii.AAC.1
MSASLVGSEMCIRDRLVVPANLSSHGASCRRVACIPWAFGRGVRRSQRPTRRRNAKHRRPPTSRLRRELKCQTV